MWLPINTLDLQILANTINQTNIFILDVIFISLFLCLKSSLLEKKKGLFCFIRKNITKGSSIIYSTLHDTTKTFVSLVIIFQCINQLWTAMSDVGCHVTCPSLSQEGMLNKKGCWINGYPKHQDTQNTVAAPFGERNHRNKVGLVPIINDSQVFGCSQYILSFKA